MVLFVFIFVFLFVCACDWCDVIVFGFLVVGVIYVYLFFGFVWLMGVVIVWGLWEVVRGGGNRWWVFFVLGVGMVVLIVLSLFEFGCFKDFVDFCVLYFDWVNEGGLGNFFG